MSFICDKCGKPQANGTKPNRIVVETRKATYENKDKNGMVKKSFGREIVKEINVCPACSR